MAGGKRHLESHGQPMTVVNFSETGTDEYGDPTLSETRTDTKGVINRPPMGNFNSTDAPQGSEVRQNAQIYIPDDIEVHDAEDDEYPSQVEFNGKTHEVIVVDDQQTGVVRLFTQRM